MWYRYVLLGLITFAGITNDHVTEAVTILQNLRCLVSFFRLGYAPEKYDQYNKFFRNESIMQVAQTGHYDGPNAIEEYTKFTDPSFTPFVKATKLTIPRFRSNGYNRTSGLCEFFTSYKIRWTLDPNLTSVPESFDMVSMAKIYFHLKERYITRINAYITPDFGRLISDAALNNDRVRSYICSQVYFGPCGSIVNTTSTPSQTVCESRLAALPTTEGTTQYIDGDVQGCRFLHAVFAEHNPTTHCFHLSFEPMTDPMGNIKCQKSKGTSPTELFTETDFKRYTAYAKKVGIDPIKGHNSPY
jgi:hypothetical protein